METRLAAQRRELATLLRAAYAVGDAAPLKLMLAQDRVADANRAADAATATCNAIARSASPR